MPAQPPAALTRVLVICATPGATAALCSLLSARGYATWGVQDAQRAVAATRTWYPDAVLIDLDLAPPGGPDLARQLRQHPATAATALVALAAPEPDTGHLPPAGPDFDYEVTTPVDPDEVERVLLQVRQRGMPGP